MKHDRCTLPASKCSGLSNTTPEPAKSERGTHTASSATRAPRLSSTVGKYLRQIPRGTAEKIRHLYREAHGGTFPRLDDKRRAILAECIFTIQNDLEHQYVNLVKSKKPKTIERLNEARNRLYDELGRNEERA